MPGISVLGSLRSDFSSKFALHSSEVFSYEPNANTMEKLNTITHVLRGENNVTSMKGQRKSFFQTVWNQYIGGNFLRRPVTFLSKMNNPLSVTLVNNEIVMPEFIEKPCMQDERSIDMMNHVSKVIFESMHSTVDSFIKNRSKFWTDFERYFGNEMEQQEIKQDNKDITIENLIYSMMDSNITCKDKSTMESHSVSNVREIEKLNSIKNNFCSTEVDLQKCTDTAKDTLDLNKNSASNDIDVNEETKSFLIVSHSDVQELVKPVKKVPISARLSVMCRNAWNSLTTRFYCRTNSMESEKSVKRRSYLLKRHCRRRANIIAMGRGRSREKCQLRRSGVSQTRHRKERTRRDLAMIIEVDYEVYRNDEMQYYGIQNDHSLNDESDNLNDMDGYDVPDGALLVKRTKPIIFNSSDIMSMKRKPQTIDPFTKNNKDCNKKTSDTEESQSQSRLLSVSSVDSEDSFIVFEANDDESKQEAAEYSTGMHYTLLKSSIEIEDYNGEINPHGNSFRPRLLSECSVNSEDSFIIFKDVGDESPQKQEAMKHPTRVHYVINPLTKINSSYHKDCDSNTYNAQKDTLRPRLLSESSSVDSEDSFIVFEGSDDELLKQETSEDSIEHDVSESSTIIVNDDCKDYNNEKYMQENSFQFSQSSEDTEDSFCIVFNTKLEKNGTTEISYIKTSTSIPTQDNAIKKELMIENDEDSEESIAQIKKVSFAPTPPIVHIMVTWDYAYRAARKGQWEEMARDNERFKGRINSIAAVLNPILTSKHRSKVWQERFAFQE
ncbi:uncharacterized protein Ppp1r15 [Anoplolepis gracilipes]|uniref:uncharacterized protein Ppp1r15 n=1 Tax=Anoplolepis gracilipes TaxID=354296 RepID=UPI003BA2808F